MRPHASTSTIAPPSVPDPTTRPHRQEVESGDEALEADTEAAKGEMAQLPAPAEYRDEALEANTEATKGEIAQPPAAAESHSESLATPAKSVRSSAQPDNLGMVDDEQTSDEGQEDYNDWVGYDDNEGYYDTSGEDFEQDRDEYGEGSDQPMDFGDDEGDTGERTQPKCGREHAESGNPRVKKSGRQSIAHSNAPTAPSTHDPSPSQVPDLNFQGASRTTGGIIRGNATGGHFKWGDAPQFMDYGSEFQSAPMGKVLLFDSCDEDACPHLSINTQTVSQLPPILKKLSAKYSPIRSKCIVYIIDKQPINYSSDNDSHIYVFQDGAWDIKGQYSQALQDEDPVEWYISPDDGRFSLSLLVDGIGKESMSASASASALGSTMAGSSKQSCSAVTDSGNDELSSTQNLIINALGITCSLAQHERGDIRMAYTKYMAIKDAVKQLQGMKKAGTWTAKIANFSRSFRDLCFQICFLQQSQEGLPQCSPLPCNGEMAVE